jgi:hypothetical protein
MNEARATFPDRRPLSLLTALDEALRTTGHAVDARG